MVGVLRRIGGTAVAVALAGCGGPVTLSAGHSAPSGAAASSSSTTSLPAVVDGVPLARLAQIALSESQAYSEPRPWDVRAAIGSDRAANALQGRDGMTYDFGDTSTKYVVALDGQFRCGDGCSGSRFGSPGSTSSTTTTVVPTTTISTSTMVLTVDPGTVSLDGSFRLVDHEVDMASLGQVYSLDPYLAALESSKPTPSAGGGQAGPPACPPGAQPSWVGTFCGPPPGPGNGTGPDGECTGSESSPPCGPGAIPGHYYAYTLPERCDGRAIFDGQLWVSELPPPQEGPPMQVWMALAPGGNGAGFIAPNGAVGFRPYTGQPPSACQPPPLPPPTPAPVPGQGGGAGTAPSS